MYAKYDIIAMPKSLQLIKASQPITIYQQTEAVQNHVLSNTLAHLFSVFQGKS